jgi:hypothetical protein
LPTCADVRRIALTVAVGAVVVAAISFAAAFYAPGMPIED